MKTHPSSPGVLLVDVGGHPIVLLPITDRRLDEPRPQNPDQRR